MAINKRMIAKAVADYYAKNKNAVDGTIVVGKVGGRKNITPNSRVIKPYGARGRAHGRVGAIKIMRQRQAADNIAIQVLTLEKLAVKNSQLRALGKELNKFATQHKNKIIILGNGKIISYIDPHDKKGEVLCLAEGILPVTPIDGIKAGGGAGHIRFQGGLGGNHYCVITGPEVVRVSENLPDLIDLKNFVYSHSTGASGTEIRNELEGPYDLGDYEPENDPYCLLIRFIRNFYLDFNAHDVSEIVLEKNQICLLSKDINRRMNIFFEAVSPEAFSVMLYVIHISLEKRWNQNDRLKESLLRNFIEKTFPDSVVYINNVREKIKNVSPNELIKDHNRRKVGQASAHDDGYEIRKDLSYWFIDKVRCNIDVQRNLHALLNGPIKTDIEASKGKRKGLKWYHVLEMMKEMKLFEENYINEVKYFNFFELIEPLLDSKNMSDVIKSGCYRNVDGKVYKDHEDRMEDLRELFWAHNIVNPILCNA